MKTFKARNANELMGPVYQALQTEGVRDKSRNGPVIRFRGPVSLTYLLPMEKVVFCPVRDANPFFHMMEGLLMLSGINDVDWLCYFNKGMARYSDDGETFNAFYGSRLRLRWFDQLRACGRILNRDPYSRQAVANIWDPKDLETNTRDKACNLSVVFSVNAGELDMIVYNRSNDAVWGSVSGANVVHFAMIQEYVAAVVGVPVGVYHQVSNNLHAYLDNPQTSRLFEHYQHGATPEGDYPETIQVCEPGEVIYFDTELNLFVHRTRGLMKGVSRDYLQPSGYGSPFLSRVAVPAFNAWHARKESRSPEDVRYWLGEIRSDDWRRACTQWVERRDG